jgi:hypothetical protein
MKELFPFLTQKDFCSLLLFYQVQSWHFKDTNIRLKFKQNKYGTGCDRAALRYLLKRKPNLHAESYKGAF